MKLEVKNASFGYKKGVPVIENLNFSVESGEILAILGPNGAGKTTLLRCIMGFLKWTDGVAYLDGEDISKMSAKKLWRRVSYVPQAKGAFAAMTAEEMIMLGFTNRIGVFSSPSENDRLFAREIAEKLGITGLLGKKCTEISGGELQMVLIARALAGKPEVLILDEPESNLDFKNQLIVLNTMSSLAAEGMCCIFNTHYPTHALTRATKSLIIPKAQAGGSISSGKGSLRVGEACLESGAFNDCPHSCGAIFGDTLSTVTEDNIRRAFGVDAVIGEVETEHNIYKSVLPLRVSDNVEQAVCGNASEKRMIAVLSVIFTDFNLGEKINAVLSEHRDDIVGRMGMPYRDAGVYIINTVLDASKNSIESLVHKIGVLPGVSVKATFAKVSK